MDSGNPEARSRKQPPAISFVGRSGVGKTTLLAAVVRILSTRGLRVGVVKHSRGFELPDRRGKDSQRLWEAGAAGVVLAGPQKTVLFARHEQGEPDFSARLALLGAELDLVLVESYASAGLPVIEVLRRGCAEVPAFRGEQRVLAFVADFPLADVDAPVLPLGEPEQVAQFVARAAGCA